MSNPTGKGGFGERKSAINKKGRPKSFDALRALAQQIAHEPATAGGKPIEIDGHIVTVTEAIMRQWAQSKDPRLVQAFIQYAYGKPPDIVQGDHEGGPVVIKVKMQKPDNADENYSGN